MLALRDSMRGSRKPIVVSSGEDLPRHVNDASVGHACGYSVQDREHSNLYIPREVPACKLSSSLVAAVLPLASCLSSLTAYDSVRVEYLHLSGMCTSAHDETRVHWSTHVS